MKLFRPVLRTGPLLAAAALAWAAAPALAIVGGLPTTAFQAVGTGVQIAPDWVLTAQHTAFSVGEGYSNGYGTRTIAARYDAPGSGTFPASDLSLLRLAPAATAAPTLAISSYAFPAGTFAALAVTITSPFNSGPARGYGFTSVTESLFMADPDDAGPLQPVVVNWLASYDTSVRVEGGDSGGGLFLGHVGDSSVLLGITSALLTDPQDAPLGSAFVQPAAYRGWIDSIMATDGADTQTVLWAAVPEPAAAWLLAAGLLALSARRLRRHP